MRDIRPLPRSSGSPRPSLSPQAQTSMAAESGSGVLPPLPSRPHGRHTPLPIRASGTRSWLKVLGLVILILGGIGFGGWQWKKQLLWHGEAGYQSLEQAADALRRANAEDTERRLNEAAVHFRQGNALLFGLPQGLPILKWVPGLDAAVSGVALMQAGTHLTAGAKALATLVFEAKTRLGKLEGEVSLLEFIDRGEPLLQVGSQEFQTALELFRYVELESLPEDKRASFTRGERLLPALTQTLSLSVAHTDLLKELLGKNGPRVYLFLFQNNHELRPTGGFIGSYALLDINHGKIRRFFVDGIFNPDGQLKENIIPPAPIQKISAGWSLHDSNWFPDFPTSAEKAMFFYEKTGGPTTDGVVALTPVVLERILEILGPIDLPEYGVTIDKENFLPLIQEEVEVKYDKDENAPKKILGDLTGVILERLISLPKEETLLQLADALVGLLNERHILLYARDERAQTLIQTSGWSGSVLSTPYDYLSVIHTNINGYKTDGVIDDTVEHTASIQPDGSIIDTVKITRRHQGGQTPYAWWNKVNANYMRVYVPQGSELLSAEGMTREFPEPPLDYAALDFKSDITVTEEASKVRVDESSGTRIGEEFGKTVFGNWVYVSPGESVTVTYRYRLPFRLAVENQDDNQPVPFSVLYQKQAGTKGTQLLSQIEYPSAWQPIWQTPENLIPYGRTLKLDTTLKHNVFIGTVFDAKT